MNLESMVKPLNPKSLPAPIPSISPSRSHTNIQPQAKRNNEKESKDRLSTEESVETLVIYNPIYLAG
jgi:hypothetical protein